MTTAPYILARTFAEAHAFAMVDLGLGKGHYRVVNSSGTLKAVRGVDLYLVPGWRQRFDRFAMQSALRWTRMNVRDVAEERAKESELERVDTMPEHLDGKVVEVHLIDATDFVTALAAEIESDEPGLPRPTRDEASEEKPVRRRRRRCDDCGILVDPDEVEQHATEHAASEDV